MLPPHLHGLQPLSFGLFHQQEVVREVVVDLFNELRAHPVSSLLSEVSGRLVLMDIVDWGAVPAGTEPLPTIRLRSAGACARDAHKGYQFSRDTPVCVHVPHTLKSQ